jgi:FSR family fosmidomycin resistance protein-like MFS transporter
MAAGRRHGLAQSMFQVGGNAGSALGPLAAAIVVVRWGQSSLAFFALLALLSCAILWNVGMWYRHHGLARLSVGKAGQKPVIALPRGKVLGGIAVLLALIFSKYVYLASLTSYFTFYLIHRFGVGVEVAQLHLFAFLGAVAVGTIAGGPLGDRFGRKHVIWFSILGALPFTLLLPHASLFWTGPLTVVIGLILASAFPAIVVFAQELVPGKIGLISGLFFGFSFGMGGLGAAILGEVADQTSIEMVYAICAWLPAIGLLAILLPNPEAKPEAT